MNDMNEWRRRAPASFPPPWASAWGDDRFGLWADFVVGEDAAVVQRMRWVEPGQFDMGAGENENASCDNERPRHRVTISAGLWLADTTCTQALWQAVGCENKSRFYAGNQGGAECPVDNVSLDDARAFLCKLELLLQGDCQATLPTEAEWEYSCRAGTRGPFSFGATITPQQVNYDENYPNGDLEKGEFRERTVAVKALPANAWGLYQMHGNVWEWCADKLRIYDGDPVTDPGLVEAREPKAADDGAARALRGGGWDFAAGFARSALRLDVEPARHDVNVGFRFALRSGSQASGPKEQRQDVAT